MYKTLWLTVAILLCGTARASTVEVSYAGSIEMQLNARHVDPCNGCGTTSEQLTSGAPISFDGRRAAEGGLVDRFDQGFIVSSGSIISGTASPGVLRAFALASVSTNGTFDGGSASAHIFSQASAVLNYADTITLKSELLAPGDAVTIRVRGQFEHVPFAEGTFPYDLRVSHSLQIPGLGINFFAGNAGFGPGPIPANQTMEEIITARVGIPFHVFGNLRVLARVSNIGSQIGSVTAVMDAGNSSTTYFDVLTPGVSLVSDSGHDYLEAAAVPEPGTAPFVIAGILTGVLRIRRTGSGDVKRFLRLRLPLIRKGKTFPRQGSE